MLCLKEKAASREKLQEASEAAFFLLTLTRAILPKSDAIGQERDSAGSVTRKPFKKSSATKSYSVLSKFAQRANHLVDLANYDEREYQPHHWKN